MRIAVQFVVWLSGQHRLLSRSLYGSPSTGRGTSWGLGAAGMCFSANASFVAAAVTATIGIATLRQARHARELPLAAVPLLFGSQQAVEGFLWLRLTGESGQGVAELSLAFLIFAKALWPAYVPFAAVLVEPEPRRIGAMRLLLALGCALLVYALIGLVNYPPSVAICGRSIDYGGNESGLSWPAVVYLLCTCAPLLLSSHSVIRIFGATVLTGFAVSAYAYFATYISVWCFFAAANSALLYFHFSRSAMQAKLWHP